MNFRFDSNARWLVREMHRRKSEIIPVVSHALREATRALYSESRGYMRAMIYDQPIPRVRRRVMRGGSKFTGARIKYYRSKSGDLRRRRVRPAERTRRGRIKTRTVKAWRRTGFLRRSERWRMQSPFVGLIINNARYAFARHQLNRPSPIDGVVRRAPWRETAIQNTLPMIRKTLRDSVLEVLRR